MKLWVVPLLAALACGLVAGLPLQETTPAGSGMAAAERADSGVLAILVDMLEGLLKALTSSLVG